MKKIIVLFLAGCNSDVKKSTIKGVKKDKIDIILESMSLEEKIP